MTDLIKYQKIVYAAPVESVQTPIIGPAGMSAVVVRVGDNTGIALVTLTEGQTVEPGDYLIRNANDGSASFMAKAAFEAEFVRAE